MAQLENWFHREFRQAQASVVELPHARAFLKFCRAHKIRTFLLSTIHANHFAAQNRNLGLDAFLDRPYTDVWDKREKIHEILRENNLKPDETLFIGDMEHDIETARHGGIHSCAVLTGYNTVDQLRAAKSPHRRPQVKAVPLCGCSALSPSPRLAAQSEHCNRSKPAQARACDPVASSARNQAGNRKLLAARRLCQPDEYTPALAASHKDQVGRSPANQTPRQRDPSSFEDPLATPRRAGRFRLRDYRPYRPPRVRAEETQPFRRLIPTPRW